MADTVIRRLTARDTRLSSFRFYDLLVHVFVVILLISNNQTLRPLRFLW
jgi:hypothetical protein